MVDSAPGAAGAGKRPGHYRLLLALAPLGDWLLDVVACFLLNNRFLCTLIFFDVSFKGVNL